MTKTADRMIEPPLYEHPEDVLGQWLDWNSGDGAALAIITSTDGGAVRAPGALMAISADGAVAGYLSGGCIDADVALNAVSALKSGEQAFLRYGVGSPFKDLPLPCGGAINVAILPRADRRCVQRCHDDLVGRRSTTLSLSSTMGLVGGTYRPKLRVRIAGRGADAVALARFCRAAGFPTELAVAGSISDTGLSSDPNITTILETPHSLPDTDDDPWTAFVLMFHDLDWEVSLLRQALEGPAFYVGAVGSRRAHKTRCDALLSEGISPDQISRIRGPVGLVPSLRDASMLAVSTLAEIVQEYQSTDQGLLANTCLALLAAGQSSRFEDGDKLLADLNGRPVIAHAADILSSETVASRIGIVGPDHMDRAAHLRGSGWQIIENPDPHFGIGSSLATAVQAITPSEGIDAV
ncbi:MAG: XdhC family protein, partial [Pseudomonadota bacterium]